jgi:hypothetical protein
MPRLRPVFIGGAGRSGTTLIADLLGTHAQISPIYETDFVLAVAHQMLTQRVAAELAAAIRRLMQVWTESLPHRPHHKRSHERYLHGPHYILFERDYALQVTEEFIQAVASDPRTAFARFVETLFTRHTERDGKTFWINKTPRYVEALDFLKQVWPDLLFLHCVRDGRDVAASALTRPWGPASWSEAGTWWPARVEPGLEFARHNTGQSMLIRYEDVLSRPAETLERVLDAVGLKEASDTVERYLKAGGVLDPSRIGGWRSHSPSDIAAFEAGGAGTLRALGYQPQFDGTSSLARL